MLSCLRKNLLLIATITSVILGVAIGMSCRLLNPSADTVMYVGFPGEIFMRMLKMMILPLVIGTIITGVSNIDSRSAGKIGLSAMALYLSTTLIATIVGLSLVLTIRPGTAFSRNVTQQTVIDRQSVSAMDVFMDLIRNLFPENVVQGMIEKIGTTYAEKATEPKLEEVTQNATNSSLFSFRATNITDLLTGMASDNSIKWTRQLVYKSGTNTVGLIMYCIVFGVILGRTGEKGKTMLSFFTTLNIITMKMVQLIMWYSPIGTFFLIASKTLAVNNIAEVARQLGSFLITVVAGLGLHSLVVQPLIYLALTRSNPFIIGRGVLQALVMSIATNSSAATLPVTMRCCEENLKLDKSITRFVLPIGTTVNMDGAAVFQVVAAIFIAQLCGIEIQFADGVVVCLCAVLASVGAAAIPAGGVVTLFLILSALALPTKDVYMILAVDWFLGRLRCVVNIFGDCLVAAILDHFFSRGSRAMSDPDLGYNMVDIVEVV